MRAKTFKGRLGALEGIERQRKKYSKEKREGNSSLILQIYNHEKKYPKAFQ